MQYPDIRKLRIDDDEKDDVDGLKTMTHRPPCPSVCTQYLICARECGHPVKEGYLDHNKECFDAKTRGEFKPCPAIEFVKDKITTAVVQGWEAKPENGEKSGKCYNCRCNDDNASREEQAKRGASGS
jgi:hypothetical protein